MKSRAAIARPRREREPDEFASFQVSRPAARMATAADLVRAPKPPVSLVAADLKPEGEPTSAAGARHMGRVAALGCRLCIRLGFGATPCEVHHLAEGRGGAKRANDFLSLGLCPPHHRGPTGVHGDKSALRRAGVTELDLLADVICELTDKP